VVVAYNKYLMIKEWRGWSAYVPEENIVGQATHVLISIDNLHHPFRLERTAQKII